MLYMDRVYSLRDSQHFYLVKIGDFREDRNYD